MRALMLPSESKIPSLARSPTSDCPVYPLSFGRVAEFGQDEEDESEEAEEDHTSSAWNVGQDNVPSGDATRRLAVMGCDWDHVAAGDLMVRLASFVLFGMVEQLEILLASSSLHQVMFRTYLSAARSKSQAGNATWMAHRPCEMH